MKPTNKRKILMITPYIPRLSYSGGQRHSYYTLKYLSPKNDITLICISPDEEGLSDVHQFCQKVIVVKRGKTWSLKNFLTTGFSRFPLLLVKYMSRELKNVITQELNDHKYDLIHCDCLYPIPNIPKTNVPIVLVDVTIEYAIYQHYIEDLQGWRKILSPFLTYDILKLKYWETYYWKNAHTVVMFSPDDQKFVSKVTGRSDIQVFYDGVDPKYLNTPIKNPKADHPTILFGVSNMKWMQNRESVDLIFKHYWPSIVNKYPNAELLIVGRFAPDFFGQYQSKNITVAQADGEDGKKNLQYYYEYSWLLLAPMGSGGGTRNKFLEGMSFGLPVITTPQGGMGSIQIKNYQHAIVCPPQDILKNVFALIEDSKYRQQMGNDARQLIKKNYSFDKCVEELNHIYDQITPKK